MDAKDRVHRSHRQDQGRGKNDVVCCKHGKPCAVGSKSKSVYEYVPVMKVKKAQSPPAEAADDSSGGSNNQQSTNYENIPDAGDLSEDQNVDSIRGSDDGFESEITDDHGVVTDEDQQPDHAATAPTQYSVTNNKKIYADLDGNSSICELKNLKNQRAAATDNNLESDYDMPGDVTTPGSPAEEGHSVPTSSYSIGGLSQGGTFSRDRVNPKEQHMEFYIGAHPPQMAERLCKKPAVFRLYHRIAEAGENEEPLQSSLPLYIVSRNRRGDFRHIRVLRSGKGLLRADIEGEPLFQSLSQLITFYDIYVSFGNSLEPFPAEGRRSIEPVGNE